MPDIDRMKWNPSSMTTGPENAPPPSSGTTTTSSGNLVRLGSRGPLVSEVQRRLGIPVDGIYGQQTLNAVRTFQASRGLPVDGVAGPATLAALRSGKPVSGDSQYAIAGGAVAPSTSMLPALIGIGALVALWYFGRK